MFDPRRTAAVVAAACAALTAPVSAQTAPVTLELVAEIGCVVCEGPEAFGGVSALALGAGRLVVGDRDEPHLRIFDFAGNLVAAVAREGQGPGEMSYPLAIASVPAGIAAVDMRSSRVIQIDAAGDDRGTVRLPGFPLAAGFEPGTERLDVSLADFRAMSASVARHDMDGGDWRTMVETVDELALRPPGESPMYFSIARRPGGGFTLGMGMERYQLVLFDADGARTRDVIRDIPRRAKTEQEIEDERESTASARARLGGEAGVRVSDLPELDIDPLHLHFAQDALRYDAEGRLWVRTRRGVDQTVFDVFASDHRYLGEVAVVGRVTAFAVEEGHIATTGFGDFDTARVRLWRVIWR